MKNAVGLFVFILAVAGSGWAESTESQRRHVCGEVVVQIKDGGDWREAGRLGCDRFLRAQQLRLPPAILGQKELTVKLSKSSGGAAHVDAASLNGVPPRKVKHGTTLATRKLQERDCDVEPLTAEGLELVYALAGSSTLELNVTGRIEATSISKTPFQFPASNMFRELNPQSQFYTYTWNAQRGRLDVDGKLDEVSGTAAFFAEHCTPDSGHPSGLLYGWLMNDDTHLYCALDFTSDNTMDGDKDYAKVYVNTASGLKEFKVSQNETAWGRPGFIYTDRVKYQHKVYEFKIPLRELGVSAGELQVAVAAYGTASPGRLDLRWAYDSATDRYLLVYNDNVGPTIKGQFVNTVGQFIGSSFTIGAGQGGETSWNGVAYDSANKRFMVVFKAAVPAGAIVAQLVNADGTLNGGTIEIAAAAGAPRCPAVAFDPVNARFLVAWGFGDVSGQLVTAGGTLSGASFPIFNTAVRTEVYASIAFDPANSNYFVSATINGPNELVCRPVSAAGVAGVQPALSKSITWNPQVTYQPGLQQFFVTYTTAAGVSAQRFDKDGVLVGSEITVATALNQAYSAAAANATYTVVAWQSGTTPGDIRARFLTPAGALLGTEIPVASTIGVPEEVPAVIIHPQNNDALVAYIYGSGPYTAQVVRLLPPAGELGFAATTYSVAENAGSATLTVSRTGGTTGTASVLYATSNGTAVAGTDYTATSGTLNFADGQPSATITIPVIDNTQPDASRTVTVTISSPVSAALGAARSAVLTITNDDGLQIVSGPTATPAAPVVNQPVAFSALSNSPTATYTWDFGDGATAAGSNVTHAFGAAGTYPVVVTVTAQTSVTAQVAVVVSVPQGQDDTDGDGFTNDVETALGTSLVDPTSRPGGLDAATPAPGELAVKKFSVKLNFGKPGNDQISLSGALPVPAGFAVQGRTVIADIGGVVRSFTLDAKGASPKANDTFKIGIKVKAKSVAAQDAGFSLKLRKGDFAGTLRDEGLVDQDTSGNVTVPVTVYWNGQRFNAAVTVPYTAKAGVSGRTK